METKDEDDNKVLVDQVANSVTRRTESRDMTTEMITTELCWFVVIFLHWFVIIFLCKLLYENTFVIRFMKTKVSGHPFGHLVKTKASDSIVIYWKPNQIWGILTSIMWEIKSIEILFRHLWKINSFDWTLMKIVASCFLVSRKQSKHLMLNNENHISSVWNDCGKIEGPENMKPPMPIY